MSQRLQIRQNFTLGDDGDKAEVARVLMLNDRVYVEVEQTMDAREPTIMGAVTAALDRFENQIRMELCHGEA